MRRELPELSQVYNNRYGRTSHCEPHCDLLSDSRVNNSPPHTRKLNFAPSEEEEEEEEELGFFL